METSLWPLNCCMTQQSLKIQDGSYEKLQAQWKDQHLVAQDPQEYELHLKFTLLLVSYLLFFLINTCTLFKENVSLS